LFAEISKTIVRSPRFSVLREEVANIPEKKRSVHWEFTYLGLLLLGISSDKPASRE
jgi:hypothetical protein